MPNSLAFLALIASPFAAALLFAYLRTDRALIWTLMLAYLLLPEPPAYYDFPLLPQLDKYTIPAMAAFALLLWRERFRAPLLPEHWLGKVLVAVFVFSPGVTAVLNSDVVQWGLIFLPGLGFKDGAGLVIGQCLLITPFLLARQFLASGGAQRELLVALMVGGLIYSIPMLIEIRLSPQLNFWVYGYYQHLFGQSLRAGGYRPVVFLYHGLWVAFFIMTATVSAWALWRSSEDQGRVRLMFFALYLSAILVLAKSFGALLFLLLLVPMIMVLSPLMQIRAALLIGILAISYPLAKGIDIVPEQGLVSAAAQVDAERANSLQFRFDNENTLLDRASERPIFGWGSWGRNHIFDDVSGRILTVTDGRWIIVLGVYGWVGFLAEFGLLILPLVLLWREAGLARDTETTPYIGALSLLLAINIVDMLPNATLTPLTWLIAGALLGYAEQIRHVRLKRPVFEAQPLRWKPVL